MPFHIIVAGQSVPVIPLVAVGLFIGCIAGMFGVGGGFLLTPILNIVFHIPIQTAVGSALCQKVGTSAASCLKYRHLKRGEVRIDLVMLGGGLIGVDAGTRLLAWLVGLGNVPWGSHGPIAVFVMDATYAVVLGFALFLLLREALRARHRPPRGDLTIPGPLSRIRIPPYIDLPNVQLKRVSVPVLAYMGLMIGMLSGLLGIGGGIAFMPILLYGYGLSVRNAAGTGILLLFASVVAGTIEQGIAGAVSLPLAMSILVGSSVGSQLGVLITHTLPNRVLRLCFAGLVAATILLILFDMSRGLI